MVRGRNRGELPPQLRHQGEPLRVERLAHPQGSCSGLTARRIADRIGYSPGTLYNVFEDLDDLVVHLMVRILDALYDECSAVDSEATPEASLRVTARAYVKFSEAHPNLWGVLFEHRWSASKERPDWYLQKVYRLLALIEAPLEPLFGKGEEARKLHTARVLWSSLHGMCSIANAGKLSAAESLSDMADSLVWNYVQGLKARKVDRLQN